MLYPPSVLQVNLRVGYMPQEDHLRYMIEVVDPQDRELLAMRSAPARRLSEHGYWPAEIERDIREMLPPILDPDPF